MDEHGHSEDAQELGRIRFVGLGHSSRSFWVGDIRISARNCPECFDDADHDCYHCEFFHPSSCPLRNRRFYISNLKTILDAHRERRLIRSRIHQRRQEAIRAVASELQAHGRPLHYAVLARIVADRHPGLRLTSSKVLKVLASNPDRFQRIRAGVYRLHIGVSTEVAAHEDNHIAPDPARTLSRTIHYGADSEGILQDGESDGQLLENEDPDLRSEDTSQEVNLLHLCQREASRYDLLTPEEEQRLAEKIHQARVARRKLRRGNLEPQAIRALEIQILQGEEAEKQFAEANLRLVIHLASRYLGGGLELMDLIQEGNLGLLKAVEKYDPVQGARFGTYAYHWIRQAMTRAIADHSRLIRLPVHIHEQVTRLRATSEQLTTQLARAPTLEEIASAMDLIEQEDMLAIRSAREMGQELIPSLRNKLRRAVSKADLLLRCADETLSLDEPIDDTSLCGEAYLVHVFGANQINAALEERLCLGDLALENLADESCRDLFDLAASQSLSEEMHRVLRTINKSQRLVIEGRFGLGDGRERTLEEIGQQLGVTRERIRQLETKALRQLSYPLRTHRLKDFVR